jgi:hypothetical protein
MLSSSLGSVEGFMGADGVAENLQTLLIVKTSNPVVVKSLH